MNMATKAIDLGEIPIGATRRLAFTFKRDGIAWAGIDSIELTFEKPDRATTFNRNMVVENDATGTWIYDLTTSDIATLGYWTLKAKVIDGAVSLSYEYPISFHVPEIP